MKQLILPALVALSLFNACSEEKAAPASAPAAAPAAAPAPQAAEAPAQPAIATPDIVVSTAAGDVKKGEEVFAAKGCNACHKVGGGKLVGPDLKGVISRRDQEWVERMILRPDIMVKEDAIAKKLLAEHFTPMPNQGVDPEKELPFILSYLKANE